MDARRGSADKRDVTPQSRDRRARRPARRGLLASLPGPSGLRSSADSRPHATVAGAGAVALVLVALLAVLVPLPTPLLDFLLASALAFGVALLVAAITIERPHELAGFPALLLGATLLRLAVNVSTTRRILGSGDAGRVVDAFAGVVAGSDLVVGLVVFGIVTMLQWMVVARGAERIAEVAARFSLDAMPGEQAAIDVDLRAGSISSTEAALRRARLIERARFHGAMDGAMRFVKGDALLGLAITTTNLVGGLAVGLLREGMGAIEALEVYGRLTIGDGLAMQIPSVLTSLAAGMLVARTEREEGARGGQALRLQPMWLATPALLCVGLALVPGMPSIAFLVVGSGLGLGAWWMANGREAATPEDVQLDVELPRNPDAPSQSLVYALVSQLVHELGIGSVRCTVRVDRSGSGEDDGVRGPRDEGRETRQQPLRVRIGGRELSLVAAATLRGRGSHALDVTSGDAPPEPDPLLVLRATILANAEGLVDLRWIEARVHDARRIDAALVDRALRRVDSVDLLMLVRSLLRERIPIPEFGVVLRTIVERMERGELETREVFVPMARTRLSPWWLPELVESLGGTEDIRWHRTTPDFEDAVSSLVPMSGKLPIDLSLAEAPRRKLIALRDTLATTAVPGGPTVILTTAHVRPLLAVLAREASPHVWVLSREEFERGGTREPRHMAWVEMASDGV